MPDAKRPQVNLDAVAGVLDRVLDHPVARIANELLPETMGAVRAIRGDLPAMASGIESRAIQELRAGARELERELVGSISSWVQETIRNGRGESRPKRLRAPRPAARNAKGKKR